MLFRHQERKGRPPLPDLQRDLIPAAAGLTDPLQRLLAGALQAAFDCGLRSPRTFVLQFLDKIIPLFAADSPAAFIEFVCKATHAKREMVRPDKPNVVFPLVRGAISRSEETALALLDAYPVRHCVRDIQNQMMWLFLFAGETDASRTVFATAIDEPFAGDVDHERYDTFLSAIYAFAVLEGFFGADEFAAKISERLFGEPPVRARADTTPDLALETPDASDHAQDDVPPPQPVQLEHPPDSIGSLEDDISGAFRRLEKLPSFPPPPVQPRKADAAKTKPARPSLMSPSPATSVALPPRSLDEPPPRRNPPPADLMTRRANLPSEPELSMDTVDPEGIFDGLRSVPPPAAGSSAYVDDDDGATIARPSSPPGTFPAFPRASQAFPPSMAPQPPRQAAPPRAGPPPLPGAKAPPGAKLSHAEDTNQRVLDSLRSNLGPRMAGATYGDPLLKILNMGLKEIDPGLFDSVLDTTDCGIMDFGNALCEIMEARAPLSAMTFRNTLADAGAASSKASGSRMSHFAQQMASTTGQPGGRLPPPPKRIPPPPPPPPPRRFG